MIPVGADRYVLYYEQTIEPEPEDEPAPTGRFAKLQRRFSELLRAAEERRNEDQDEQAPTSRIVDGPDAGSHDVLDRETHRGAAAVVESAEAGAVSSPSIRATRPSMRCCRTFSRRCSAISSAIGSGSSSTPIGLVVSGLLAIVPGPNLLAYFFLFRVGGHWLSMRGATQGRRRVQWEGRPCELLNGLREALHMGRRERHGRVQQIASTLHLRHLPTFFERVTAK